ncbi:MAG TPA: ATP-grasp domain-containing protein [Deltaproteobacteria bacterium]|nr:ATP-grasp domain-containing protein [Deltaproteobacteria bacterium]
MAAPKTIAIIHNPVSELAAADERDVLDQVEEIVDSVGVLGYAHEVLPFNPNLVEMKQALQRIKPYCIFNLVEAVDGDSKLQHLAPAFYDHLGIPYTGASTEALFLTTHKVLAKKWMSMAQVPTAEWLAMENPPMSAPTFPGRYIIKPVSEEASVGLDASAIVTADSREELMDLVRERQRLLGKACFAERYIEGREFNLSLLGRPGGVDAMPPAEMNFDFPEGVPKIMDYKAKWVEGTLEWEGTQRTFDLPPSDNDLLEKLKAIAKRCWDLFHLRGYARVDFRVDKQGEPFVLEINANPCITSGSGFPVACEKSGLGYDAMVQRILEDTLGRESLA